MEISEKAFVAITQRIITISVLSAEADEVRYNK